MRSVLLNAPWQDNDALGVRAGSRWPFTCVPKEKGKREYIPFPFLLAYATALLKKKGKNACLIDAIAEGINDQSCLQKVIAYAPDLILLEISTPSFYNDLRFADKLAKNLPKTVIALSGPHATVFAQEILADYDYVDYILCGEYEYILLELVVHLQANQELAQVSGLVYREGQKIIVNAPRKILSNLNELPWPERQDVPIYNYNDGFAGLPKPNVQIWSSRGCLFSCSFCLWPQVMYGGQNYRLRDAQDVVNEMEYLKNNLGFKAIYFDDDTFNIDRNHVLDICHQINMRKLSVTWAAMARADLMDKDLLDVLFSSGLYAVKYGIESGHQGINDACGKKLNLEKAREIIRLTKNIGIKVHLTFCLGLLKETRQSIKETIRFIESVKPDSLQFSVLVPFPGTQAYADMQKRGLLVSNKWDDYDGGLKCNVKTEELGNEELSRIVISLRKLWMNQESLSLAIE